MSIFKQYIWPTIAEAEQADRAVKRAYLAATVLSATFFLTAFLGTYTMSGGADHRLDFVDGALFMVFGYFIKGKDPYAAVMLFLLCLAETFLRLSMILFPAWLVLIVIYLGGMRATFWLLGKQSPTDTDTGDATPSKPAFFGIAGRLNRRWYGLYLAYLVLGSTLVLYGLWGLLAGLGVTREAQVLLAAIGLVPVLGFFIVLTVQRCHDFDRSGWRGVFLLLPVLGLLGFLIVPGSAGKNSYGTPNT